MISSIISFLYVASSIVVLFIHINDYRKSKRRKDLFLLLFDIALLIFVCYFIFWV